MTRLSVLKSRSVAMTSAERQFGATGRGSGFEVAATPSDRPKAARTARRRWRSLRLAGQVTVVRAWFTCRASVVGEGGRGVGAAVGDGHLLVHRRGGFH